MKYRIPQLIGLIAIYLLGQSCATPFIYSSNTSISKVSHRPCIEKIDRVLLFFEGDPIKFKYEKVGVVEFDANYVAHDQAKLDYLRNEAWNNCANGIIQIRDDYQWGIAVNIEDPNFLSLDNSIADTSFAEYVRKDKAYLAKKARGDRAASSIGNFFGLVIVGGIMILPYLAPEED